MKEKLIAVLDELKAQYEHEGVAEWKPRDRQFVQAIINYLVDADLIK